MGVTFSVVHGCQGLPDRAPCMQGGRWCVASKHTPQLPPDGSDLPRELMPVRDVEVRASFGEK